MENETTQTESSLADTIVKRVTSGPTVGRSMAQTQGLMAQSRERGEAELQAAENDLQSYMNQMVSTIREERSPLAVDASLRPKSYSDSVSELKQPAKAETLKQDDAFMANLNRMKEKFPGLTDREVFKVIEGESAYNPTAKSKAGAVGLFQMMPEPLSELGYTSAEVISMEPAEQLLVYEQYLNRWGYDGSVGLGILQAAPAYRDADPDTVIYKKGSKEWKMNKGWRSRNNGDITRRSIEAYYGRVS